MVGARTTKTSFSLEEYEVFLENPYMSKFSIPQLNQVINMHGFNKIYRRPKIQVFNVISTIDLAKPYRSTLQDDDDYGGVYIQPGNFSLSSGQVKRDLEDLNWQECYIHTMETTSPAAPEKNRVPNVSVPKDFLASMELPITRRSRSQKRKKRCFVNAVGEDSAVAGGDYPLGVQGAADATAAAAVKAVADAGCTSLYVDTYRWGL